MNLKYETYKNLELPELCATYTLHNSTYECLFALLQALPRCWQHDDGQPPATANAKRRVEFDATKTKHAANAASRQSAKAGPVGTRRRHRQHDSCP